VSLFAGFTKFSCLHVFVVNLINMYINIFSFGARSRLWRISLIPAARRRDVICYHVLNLIAR